MSINVLQRQNAITPKRNFITIRDGRSYESHTIHYNYIFKFRDLLTLRRGRSCAGPQILSQPLIKYVEHCLRAGTRPAPAVGGLGWLCNGTRPAHAVGRIGRKVIISL